MKKKILLIDDDVLVLKTVRNLLTQQGYDVYCAKTANEAMEQLRKASPHLIVCDIRMPGKSGIDLIKELKKICQDENRPAVPFIFITGYASEDAPIEAIKLGAKDYILKPFDLDELTESIRKSIQ